MSNTIELEFDAANNGDFAFRPAGKTIRGRFDVQRLPEAGKLRSKFPTPIPGQRLCFDYGKGECFIREPLYDAAHEAVRAEIEKSFRLPPAKQTLPVDAPTFTWWVSEAIKTPGLKVISGSLQKVQGEPQKHFRHAQEPSDIQMLTSEFRRLGDLLEKVLAKK